MQKIIRPDFIFSYWIFAWAVLYIAHLVTISPKFVLICGIIENLILLFIMIYKNTYFYSIFKFIFINFWIKIIPLYLVWNTKITSKEIKYSAGLVLIYIVWLYINDYDFYKIYKDIYDAYVGISNKHIVTSISYLYDKIYDKIYDYIKPRIHTR